MASTFYGLNIAYSGLNAYQAALNTTGHNISNVETEGYCRQYVEQTAADALKTNTTAGMQGAGVVVNGINQHRDIYYDYKYWDNSAKLGEAETQYYYMLQIENYFKGSSVADSADSSISKMDDFNAMFSNMFNALEEVAKNPSDTSYRNSFIQSAKSFTDYFNSIYQDLQRLQEDVNLEIKSKVNEINSIAEQIATLNKQINVIEGSVATRANDLRDKRAVLIDKLSDIVPVSVEEIPIKDSNDPTRNTGMYTYNVKLAGQTLVSGSDYNTLILKSRTNQETVNQTDVVGLYDLEWSNGLEFSATNPQMGGQLKALFDIRDGNNKENFSGTIDSVDVAKNIITISKDSVPAAYQSVYGVNLPEQGVITIRNAKLSYDSFEIDNDGNYIFHLREGQSTVAGSMAGATVSVGESVDYMGLPYYLSQLNEFSRKFAQSFNEIHTGNQDLNGKIVGNFFTGIDSVDGSELQLNEGNKTGGDCYYRLTAANFTVRDEFVKDSSRLATTGNVGEGVEQVDVLNQLKELRRAKNFYNGGTTEEFLQCLITDIALDAQRSKTMSKNYDNIGKTIDQQRLSISGVDNDEEALNLVKYQNAYNLSAKMMQIMTEIYDRLILETGV